MGTKIWSTAAPWRADHWVRNQWVKIQVVWNKSSKKDSIRIYVNGKRVNKGDKVAGRWNLGSEKDAGYIYVGCANDEGDFPANGIIDEFKISKSTKIEK